MAECSLALCGDADTTAGICGNDDTVAALAINAEQLLVNVNSDDSASNSHNVTDHSHTHDYVEAAKSHNAHNCNSCSDADRNAHNCNIDYSKKVADNILCDFLVSINDTVSPDYLQVVENNATSSAYLELVKNDLSTVYSKPTGDTVSHEYSTVADTLRKELTYSCLKETLEDGGNLQPDVSITALGDNVAFSTSENCAESINYDNNFEHTTYDNRAESLTSSLLNLNNPPYNGAGVSSPDDVIAIHPTCISNEPPGVYDVITEPEADGAYAQVDEAMMYDVIAAAPRIRLRQRPGGVGKADVATVGDHSSEAEYTEMVSNYYELPPSGTYSCSCSREAKMISQFKKSTMRLIKVAGILVSYLVVSFCVETTGAQILCIKNVYKQPIAQTLDVACQTAQTVKVGTRRRQYGASLTRTMQAAAITVTAFLIVVSMVFAVVLVMKFDDYSGSKLARLAKVKANVTAATFWYNISNFTQPCYAATSVYILPVVSGSHILVDTCGVLYDSIRYNQSTMTSTHFNETDNIYNLQAICTQQGNIVLTLPGNKVQTARQHLPEVNVNFNFTNPYYLSRTTDNNIYLVDSLNLIETKRLGDGCTSKVYQSSDDGLTWSVMMILSDNIACAYQVIRVKQRGASDTDTSDVFWVANIYATKSCPVGQCNNPDQVEYNNTDQVEYNNTDYVKYNNLDHAIGYTRVMIYTSNRQLFPNGSRDMTLRTISMPDNITNVFERFRAVHLAYDGHETMFVATHIDNAVHTWSIDGQYGRQLLSVEFDLLAGQDYALRIAIDRANNLLYVGSTGGLTVNVYNLTYDMV